MSENFPLLIGILSVMMCPMVFGAVTMIYSIKVVEEKTPEQFEEINDD